jgi:hypothetical protein
MRHTRARVCDRIPTAWRHIPEECNVHCHHHENHESHYYFIFMPVNFTMCQQCTFSLHTLQHWKRDECYMTVYLEHSGLLGCDTCHHASGADFWRHQQTQGHYLPLTCQELLAQWHGITSQTAWILSKNAVRTSNLDNFISLSYVTFMCLRNFKCDS